MSQADLSGPCTASDIVLDPTLFSSATPTCRTRFLSIITFLLSSGDPLYKAGLLSNFGGLPSRHAVHS